MMFQVQHPQLECSPNNQRSGLKRYPTRKNQNSPLFQIGHPQQEVKPAPVKPKIEVQPQLIFELNKLKQELHRTKSQVRKLKTLTPPPLIKPSPSELIQKTFSTNNVRKISYASKSPIQNRVRPEDLYKQVQSPVAKTPSPIISYGKPGSEPKFEKADQFNRLFRQPKYTKNNPKMHFSNPLTGISNRRMANYGEMQLNTSWY